MYCNKNLEKSVEDFLFYEKEGSTDIIYFEPLQYGYYSVFYIGIAF